jgi:FAD/FMN-containing dehydrogenase
MGRQATPQASPEVVVASSALEDLRSRLNGTLMLPTDSGYETASAPANGRYLDIRPIAVARCVDEADVVTCILWCNENGVPPVGRGGGHSYAGFSADTGLMIDLRRLNSVHVDYSQETVVMGGAALNNDMFIATENAPLFLPGGTCLGVGFGGLTLGGGIGYNAHWAGLTCDHLLSSRIVTASGEVLDIDENTNDDLYWACRGGAGGTFGINTSLTFSMVQTPQDDIAYFRYEWMGADAAFATQTVFDTLIQTAPAAFNGVIMTEPVEIGSAGPEAAVHTMSRGQYIGPLAELEELVAPLLEAAPNPTVQTLEALPFWAMQRIIATEEPEPHSFGDLSRYSDRALPQDVIADVVDLLVNCPSRSADASGSFWSLGWVGGDVIGKYGRTETAYVHRTATTLLRPTTVWPNDAPASVGDELNGWTDDVIAAITPHTPNESYQNFPNRRIQDWQEQYFGENFDRLVEVKTKYDPGNLFHNEQSVPPR